MVRFFQSAIWRFVRWSRSVFSAFSGEQFWEETRLSRPKLPARKFTWDCHFFLGGDVVVAGRGFHFFSFWGGRGKVFLHPLSWFFFPDVSWKLTPPTHWHEFHCHFIPDPHQQKNLQEKHLMYQYIYLITYYFSMKNRPNTWIGKYTIVTSILYEINEKNHLPRKTSCLNRKVVRWS